MRVYIFTLVLCVFCLNAFADEAWQPVSGIKESDIKEVVVREGVVYASSGKGLYRSEDNGETWNEVFTRRGDSNTINFIAVSEQGVFICTQNGLFKSADGRINWKRLFKGLGLEENNILHIAFSEDDVIYLGTGRGLFTSSDNGATWQKDPNEAGNLTVRWISFLGDIVFIAAETGVYKRIDSGWERVFVTQTEESEYDSDSADAQASAIRPVNSIFVKEENIFLATDNGIFISEDKGDVWNSVTSNGLLSQKVNRIVFKDNLYAVTDKGVFVFLDNSTTWKALYKGMAGDRTNSISMDSKGRLWVATNKGLYMDIPHVIARREAPKQSKEGEIASAAYSSLAMTKEKEDVRNDKGSEEENILKEFDREPTIREVHEAAIKYAEVHPDKIKQWRAAASKKAFLPDVSVGVDRYVTDYWHWDAGANPDVLQKGDDVISWDLTMAWDLGELIWNDDQTSIDTRSRLMVQLRDDILDEITRTYFERRRLQIETHLYPPEGIKEKIEKRLRIDELTADLDAMTGGYFSQKSDRNRP